MTRKALYAAIFGFLLMGGSRDCCLGQERFATAQLRRIAEKTGIAMPDGEGLNYRTAIYKGYPVSITLKEGVVTHIGYSLFTPSQRATMQEAQCDFIERLALTSDVEGVYGDKPFARHLLEEKITFEQGSVATLKAYCTDTAFVFQTTLDEGRRHICNWYSYNAGISRRTVTLSYPADAKLILGATMTELEDALPDCLARFEAQPSPTPEVAASALTAIAGMPFYVAQGDIFLLPALNSNRYYSLGDDGQFRLLYRQGWPCEELANMATGTELVNAIEVEILLVKYGFRTETIRVPLRQYVGYCMAEGCTPYFGIISHEADTIVAELVMNNTELGYAHIMKMTCPVEAVQSGKGLATARLNSYVPMSKVKSLFYETEKH